MPRDSSAWKSDARGLVTTSIRIAGQTEWQTVKAKGKFLGPKLYTWLTTIEAIEAFGGQELAEFFADEQFVVLPSVVLCFITTGETTDESHVATPSVAVWRPKTDTTPAHTSHDDWLPEKVREVWRRTGSQVEQIRTHQLFLRKGGDERFLYAGQAHLGSYGSARTTDGTWGFSATFSLKKKLPRKTWLHLGGYPGWLVEVNHTSHRVEKKDMSEFKRLVDELVCSEYSHLCMTRYEEDSLTVHTNARRGWLMYLRHPSDGGVYPRDLDFAGPLDAIEEFQCVCGIDLEFAASQTLPRELAQQAAIEFFRTGRLPECVHWELED